MTEKKLYDQWLSEAIVKKQEYLSAINNVADTVLLDHLKKEMQFAIVRVQEFLIENKRQQFL